MEFDDEGAATGAIGGAAVGTAIMPGVGTVLGGLGGAAIGGFLGGALSGTADVDQYAARSNAIGARQTQNADMLGQWARTGQGPSAAQAMVQRNRAENAAQQVGMAKTMGGDNALANRAASEGITQGNAEAAYQGQQLRAQEQQAVMQQYTQALASQRAAEVAQYQAQLGVSQKNAENRAQFLGGMMSGAGGMMGGFF